MATALTPTTEQIETLRDLFLKKLEKDGPPCEGGFHPDDIDRVKTSNRWLQLFLEQFDLDMKQALNMLWETCIWRKTYGTNEISEKNIRMDYIESGILYPRNADKDGKLLLIFKSKIHTKGSRDTNELIKSLVYWIERLQRQTNLDQMTLFFDMQGAGLSNMDIDFIKRIIDTYKLYYPNSLNYIIIFEMPWVLNAAFKMIKGLLPPKAVARMKFVNQKTMKEVIPENNILKSWGGPDDYEFKFEPENRQQQSTTPVKAIDESKTDTSTQPGVMVNTSTKKVHFANPSPPDSPMTELSGLAGNDGELLRLSPDDAIIFKRSGNDCVGSVTISNVSATPLTYKVKTTSPDKFRVKPSSGILQPTTKSTINVILHQGQELTTISKDKFLVMCMAISEETAVNDQAVADLWKNTPASSSQVEQHRLRCSMNQNVPNDSVRNGKLNSGALYANPETTDRQISHFNTVLSQLSDSAVRLEQQMKRTQKMQFLILLIFFVLSVFLFYAFKIDLIGPTSSGARQCVKNTEL